ncbi:MAG: hypothetical protein ABI758_06750 [Candidatus Woesebacteria bacterium]
MQPSETNPLLSKHGVSGQWSENPSPGANTPKAEAAKTAARYNTVDYIAANFMSTQNPTVRERIDTKDGWVALVHPTSGYMPGAQMIIAGPHEMDTKPGTDLIRTHTIYELSTETQKLYWRLSLLGLAFSQAEMHDRFPDDKGPIVYVDNNMSVYTNPHIRTSRSVGLHHGQVMKILESSIVEQPSDLHHLEVEKQIVIALLKRRKMHLEIAEWMKQLDPKKENVPIVAQLAEPVGYSFTLPGTTTSDRFTHIMALHHEAYIAVSKDLEREFQGLDHLVEKRSGYKNRIPSPSYRTIIQLKDNGDLCVYISPAFHSPAGPLEVLGVELDRNPKYPRFLSPSEKKSVDSKFHSFLEKSLYTRA